MKNFLLLLSVTLLSITCNSQAAFTPLTNGDYRMVITSGCFAFGDCTTIGSTQFIDNGETVTSSLGTFGTGIGGDGVVGIIDFTFTDGNIAVNSYSQDSYLNTPGGTVALDVTDLIGMGGMIDNVGNMEFDPTGRIAIAQFFADIIGAQPWNIDNASNIGSVTGLYEPWTTGTSINKVPGSIDVTNDVLSGVALQDAGPGAWTGTLVSAGNVGTAWGPFNGTPYTEVFDVTITELGPPVPGVTVNIVVQGGNVQECSQNGGSPVTFIAEIELFNGGELSTLEWFFDGELISAGTDFSVTPFASLGSHVMEVTATLVTGHSDTDSQAMAIQDTLNPEFIVEFVDLRTRESITEITDNSAHFVEVQMLAEDVCDPLPVVEGSVVPVFPVNNTDVIKVKGNKGQINMPTTALNLSGSTKDASGNTNSGSATLRIIGAQ